MVEGMVIGVVVVVRVVGVIVAGMVVGVVVERVVVTESDLCFDLPVTGFDSLDRTLF